MTRGFNLLGNYKRNYEIVCPQKVQEYRLYVTSYALKRKTSEKPKRSVRKGKERIAKEKRGKVEGLKVNLKNRVCNRKIGF